MMPDDEFEVVAADAGEGFYFHLLSEEKGVKVYAEGDVTQVSVYHNGAELPCGHNRREDAW
jgi:hypothetical protein